MTLPGWTVTRVIPNEVLAGLMSGQYKLYGGVVRWAAGTENAGRIVRHLIPAGFNPLGAIPGIDFIPGIIANVQIEGVRKVVKENSLLLTQLSSQVSSLSYTTQSVLQVATGTAVFSGLGLAVSCISFAILNKKLEKIDTGLKAIQKDIQAIRQFLESTERARLRAAMSALLKVCAKTPIEHRYAILHHSRNTFAEINMRYRELFLAASTIEEAMISEEYFTLTAISQIRCTAELGMLDIACQEMQEMNEFWQGQANRISKEIIIGEHPERFLATDFVDHVSVAELIHWLDFIYETPKGLAWIDELRQKIDEPWYSTGWFSGSGSGLNRNVGPGLDKDREAMIPALRKLMARGSAYEGYVTQYKFFENQAIKPSEFEQTIAKLSAESSVDGYFILEPIQVNQRKRPALSAW